MDYTDKIDPQSLLPYISSEMKIRSSYLCTNSKQAADRPQDGEMWNIKDIKRILEQLPEDSTDVLMLFYFLLDKEMIKDKELTKTVKEKLKALKLQNTPVIKQFYEYFSGNITQKSWDSKIIRFEKCQAGLDLIAELGLTPSTTQTLSAIPQSRVAVFNATSTGRSTRIGTSFWEQETTSPDVSTGVSTVVVPAAKSAVIAVLTPQSSPAIRQSSSSASLAVSKEMQERQTTLQPAARTLNATRFSSTRQTQLEIQSVKDAKELVRLLEKNRNRELETLEALLNLDIQSAKAVVELLKETGNVASKIRLDSKAKLALGIIQNEVKEGKYKFLTWPKFGSAIKFDSEKFKPTSPTKPEVVQPEQKQKSAEEEKEQEEQRRREVEEKQKREEEQRQEEKRKIEETQRKTEEEKRALEEKEKKEMEETQRRE